MLKIPISQTSSGDRDDDDDEETTQKTRFDLDRLEQYGRRESIRIHGVEEKSGENTNEIVVELAKDIGVDITEAAILASHRLPGRRVARSGDKQSKGG